MVAAAGIGGVIGLGAVLLLSTDLVEEWWRHALNTLSSHAPPVSRGLVEQPARSSQPVINLRDMPFSGR